MAENSLFNIASLTGGPAGQAAPKPAGFSSDYRYYYLCLAFLAVVLHQMLAGPVLMGLGVAAVAFAVYRHGGWNGRSRG